MQPVQPIVLKYNIHSKGSVGVGVDPSWTIGTNLLWLVFRQCCQVYNTLDVEYLSVVDPYSEATFQYAKEHHLFPSSPSNNNMTHNGPVSNLHNISFRSEDNNNNMTIVDIYGQRKVGCTFDVPTSLTTVSTTTSDTTTQHRQSITNPLLHSHILDDECDFDMSPDSMGVGVGLQGSGSEPLMAHKNHQQQHYHHHQQQQKDLIKRAQMTPQVFAGVCRDKFIQTGGFQSSHLSATDTRFFKSFLYDIDYICDKLYLNSQFCTSQYLKLSGMNKCQLQQFVEKFQKADVHRVGVISLTSFQQHFTVGMAIPNNQYNLYSQQSHQQLQSHDHSMKLFDFIYHLSRRLNRFYELEHFTHMSHYKHMKSFVRRRKQKSIRKVQGSDSDDVDINGFNSATSSSSSAKITAISAAATTPASSATPSSNKTVAVVKPTQSSLSTKSWHQSQSQSQLIAEDEEKVTVTDKTTFTTDLIQDEDEDDYLLTFYDLIRVCHILKQVVQLTSSHCQGRGRRDNFNDDDDDDYEVYSFHSTEPLRIPDKEAVEIAAVVSFHLKNQVKVCSGAAAMSPRSSDFNSARNVTVTSKSKSKVNRPPPTSSMPHVYSALDSLRSKEVEYDDNEEEDEYANIDIDHYDFRSDMYKSPTSVASSARSHISIVPVTAGTQA